MRPLLLLLAGCSTPVIVPDTAGYQDAAPTPQDAAPAPEAASLDAPAGPTPVSATEGCTGHYTDGTGTYLYAEHTFAGASMQQLAGVQVVAHAVGQQAAYAPPGYAYMTGGVFVKDGAVAFACGLASMPAFDTVTFTLP